jgi:hypothetical protein
MWLLKIILPGKKKRLSEVLMALMLKGLFIGVKRWPSQYNKYLQMSFAHLYQTNN